MKVSIVIPVLNESELLVENLKRLQWARQQGHEIVVVDGGSRDGSVPLAKPLADSVIQSAPGRARQMNAGASSATGDILLFLHIDTLLPEDALTTIADNIGNQTIVWGRFDVRLSGKHPLFRIIESMMNWRSRLSGIATGDQAIFLTHALFSRVNGFSNIPLMEDIELCKRLKKIIKPTCLAQKVVTSSRRWELGGIYRTIWLMWRLRFAYWRGADPAHLSKQYRQ